MTFPRITTINDVMVRGGGGLLQDTGKTVLLFFIRTT